MQQNRQPYEIARETVRLLTARKLAPSPENYQAVYHEVAGTAIPAPFPADALRRIVQALPALNPGQQKQRALLEYAVDRHNWEGIHSAFVAYGGFAAAAAKVNGGDAAQEGQEAEAAAAPAISAPAFTAEFFKQIARFIEYTLPALGSDDERFTEQAQQLVSLLQQPAPDAGAAKLALVNFSHRLSFAAEDQAEVKQTLLRLLQLIIQNIGQLSLDDRWLQGQVQALQAAATPPLTLRRLDEVEHLLKDVIFKQTEAKGRALEAQEQMKQMLAAFIDRLSQMADSSSSYDSKIVECARLIEQAKSIEEIAPVLQDAINATRHMSQDTKAARDELAEMREKAQSAEAEIAKLHQELDRISVQARHDPLTGALNRTGLDEAMHRELSTTRRKGRPMCIAVLDIDNFKKLNDRLGHAAGDAALTHLAQVTRESLRPQDTLARYGGEEFIVLLPDTALEAGIAAMTRLQRELTTRLFLSGKEKILITFSAGVAQLADEENGTEGIRRADQAMYLAKRAGKNRVLGA